MPIAVGVNKRLAFKAETVWGTAPGPTAAQVLRRVTSMFTLKKAAVSSSEIRGDYQYADVRHGARSVEGKISGELSAGSYSVLFAALLRSTFVAVTGTVSNVGITAAVTNPQYTRATGSFLTDGIKVGQVVRCTGWTTTAVGNNAKNFFVTAVTATQLTGVHLNASAVIAKASGDSVSIVPVGKQCLVPETGHLDPSFAFENWHNDVSASELFLGCKVSKATVKMPVDGLCSVDFEVMGRDVTTAATAYYTTPTAATATGTYSAVNGAIIVQGVAVATFTSLELTIDGQLSMLPVIGSAVSADISEGSVKVTGTGQILFENTTFRDNFLNEDEVSVTIAMTASNAAAADVMTFSVPRVKFLTNDKDDGQKGLSQSVTFQALFNAAGGAGTSSERTTIVMQDSQAA